VTIRKIEAVYRKAYKIGPEKTITISLDGDVLEETETVRDLALDNEDLLDVQIDDA
jgi:hypothetical protein